MAAITDVIDEMLERAAQPRWRERIAAMRATFESRTGAFTEEDSFFEARSAAFWDDALTRGGFAHEFAPDLSDASRAAAPTLARAQRGLFRVARVDGEILLVDEWGGAEWLVMPTTPGLRDALERATSLVDGRVVGHGGVVSLLPGAVFHGEDATAPIRALLPEARKEGLATHDVLDGLLRMERALRTLSRVKAAFAYRKEALKAP